MVLAGRALFFTHFFDKVRKNAGLPIEVPKNYYPNDDDSLPPRVSWRSSANLLFINWLNYFVYQNTPFELEAIGTVREDEWLKG